MSSEIESVKRWLADCEQVFAEHAAELNDLDRQVGDGDHGSNMHRGFRGACGVTFAGQVTPSDAFRRIGMALVSSVGGASGPLFGTLFLRIGQYWSEPLTAESFLRAVQAGVDGVTTRGKAQPGDATMVDALAAGATALQSALGQEPSLAEALQVVAEGARRGAEATRDMVARRGRAAHFGEKSLGHLDPGAVSVALIAESAARTLNPVG